MEMVQVPQVQRSAVQLVQSSYYVVGSSDQDVSYGQSRVNEPPRLSFKSDGKHGFKIYKIKTKSHQSKKADKPTAQKGERSSMELRENYQADDESRYLETERPPRLTTFSRRSEKEEHKERSHE